MTEEQIKTYEYCKDYWGKIATWKKALPFGAQNLGCGSQAPNIEHTLENIHRDMHNEVHIAMTKASDRIKDLIDKL